MKIIFTIQITATACVCLLPLLPTRLLPSKEQWILWLENKNNIVEKVSLQATPLDSLLWKGWRARKGSPRRGRREEEVTRGGTIRSGRRRRRRENWKCG